MKSAKVLGNLRKLLSYEELEAQARASGALVRVRALHPVIMLEAMLATVGNSGGRLADALRYLELYYKVRVDRSSFYKRLDKTFAKFVHDVMERVMRTRTVAEHPALLGKLEGLRDLWAWDSTSVALRRVLASTFAVGRESERAGAKLHAAVSLRTQAIVRPKLTAQRTSDERGIDLGRDLGDVLVLLDRGYSGHKLFASIEDSGGLYLTRLKTSTNPLLAATHDGATGVASAAGITLDEALEAEMLSMDEAIDIDVELSLGKKGALPARVVGLPIDEGGETKVWWYLTNLPRNDFPPTLLRELYRLRWQIELLWKQLKGRFRLDDIEALTEHNVRLIMETAILAHFLSLGVLDAVTSPAERKGLTVGRMALAFPFAVPNLVKILLAEDEDEALERAADLRSGILHAAVDTNPKRTRIAAAKRAQKLRSARNHA